MISHEALALDARRRFGHSPRSVALGIAMLLGVALPVAGQADSELGGCYRIDFLGEGLTEFEPPAVFRLQTVQIDSEGGVARPAISGSRRPAYGTWRIVAADSLRVSWSDGTSGLALSFAVNGDALSGTASSWSHVEVVNGPPRPSFALRGTRIDCSGPPRGAGEAYPDSSGLWAAVLGAANRQEPRIRQLAARPVDDLGRPYAAPVVRGALSSFAQQAGAPLVADEAPLPSCPSGDDVAAAAGYQLRVHEPAVSGSERGRSPRRMVVLAEWWCGAGAGPAGVRTIWQSLRLRHLETGWVAEPGEWVFGRLPR